MKALAIRADDAADTLTVWTLIGYSLAAVYAMFTADMYGPGIAAAGAIGAYEIGMNILHPSGEDEE